LAIKVPLENIGQRAILKIADGMCYDASGLVDNNQPWVFVDDGDGCGWGAGLKELIGRFDQPDADGLAGEDAVGGFGGVIIDAGQP
jgi:hypothetical protein